MLAVLQIILLALSGFFCLYLATLSVLALAARRRAVSRASPSRRFAVVVPAHNEEVSLGGTVKNLLALDYPRSCFDVIVVADNCNDRTADVARESGAIVEVRTDSSLRGKGYALRWCFDRLLAAQQAYDAIIVIDADSEASANFLTIMNFYLARGAGVIQASDIVASRPGAWSSEMTRIGFTLYNHVRPLGRSVIGFSAGLRGNGMCFSARVLREFPWGSFSVSEDLEYALELALVGVKVQFAPEATVLATMPANAENALSQRARWEAGRVPFLRKYTVPLLKAAVRRKSFWIVDTVVDLWTPALVNLVAVIAALTAVTLVLALLGAEDMGFFALLWCGVGALALIHLFVGLVAAGADRAMYQALLHLPRYAVWKALLYAKILRTKRTDEWVRTTRESPSA